MYRSSTMGRRSGRILLLVALLEIALAGGFWLLSGLVPGGREGILIAAGILGSTGIVLVVVFAERALYLHRGQIRSTAFLSGIKNILAKRRLVEALTGCEETPGPVAAVVKAALLHADDDAEAMRFHVQEAAVVELQNTGSELNRLSTGEIGSAVVQRLG